MWGYELNLYTLALLDGSGVGTLFAWRGFFMAALAPLFLAGGSGGRSLRIRLSRAATFQSLSLLGLCGYFAIMAVLATALRRSQWDWSGASTVALLAVMMVTTAVLVLSQRVHGWIKVKLAKHLFEHRYDYRGEWLRFTETLGRAGADAPPLSRDDQGVRRYHRGAGRVLLVNDSGTVSTSLRGIGRVRIHRSRRSMTGRILGKDRAERAHRRIRRPAPRLGQRQGPLAPAPRSMLGDERMWAGVPLIHHERLIGVVVLAASDYKRPLDWEDFDLLRAAGRHAASALAEAHVQQALSQAQRFEEFNRRFAFILHDVKNLVSQLSLLARNAERHADNPDFRADMVATLKSSVGKMNELLTRLAPHSPTRVQRVEPQPLRTLLTSAIAAKRGDHDVRLLGDAGLWAMVDAAALEHAVGHLIQNAAEACSARRP